MLTIKNNNILLILLLFISSHWIHAENINKSIPNLPVDVSYLIVDLKFTKKNGAQICEIQHGVVSSFKGDKYSNNGIELIAQNFVKELGKFYEKSWVETESVRDVSSRQLLLVNDQWIKINKFENLLKDRQFLLHASLPVYDPEDLFSYHGFVIIKPKATDNRELFRKKYPGVVFIDNAIYLYQRDKGKINQFLRNHPIAEKHKPKWNIYKTKYHKNLATTISQEIGSDLLVIKPINGIQGRGVIILKKEDLNQVLEGILNKDEEKIPKKDSAYQYWLTTPNKFFMVEEFADSDPVRVLHLGGKFYSPTIRIAFLLFYSKRNIEIVCLGGYNKLPKKALSDEGTLNEKHKSAGTLPYFCKADPLVIQEAGDQLKEVLTVVYRRMLGLEQINND